MANNGRVTIDVDINGHIKGFEQAIQQANQQLQKLKIDDKATKGAKEMFKTLQSELTKYEQLSQDALSGKNVASALNKSKSTIISTLKSISREYQALDKDDIGISDQIKTLQDRLEILRGGFKDTGAAIADTFGPQVTTSMQNLGKSMEAGQKHVNNFITKLREGNPEEIAQAFQELSSYAKRFAGVGTDGFKKLGPAIRLCEQANDEFTKSMGTTAQEIEKIEGEIQTLSDQDLASLQSILEKLGIDFGDFTRWLNESTDGLNRTSREIRDNEREFANLENRIKHFFSLTNGFMLFRRAVQGAFNTVKELDAVMTETAVVTDFSVSDMWEKLPEYTKMANELGATTKGAYETATLYYQQGLKTNEVMAVSAETMKMARIAGLDYATATDYMTAALRGFNMEINTDSAERVNDVYSRLAAITASNTQEISVAMTKVASLAHNANMEFETTAAFLAQIIETTRESAETAGTALKTVVARFTEVKKLYNEGELLGTDEEGEEIDVNKVSTALRSAGIDMNKYFTGQVGLDDIFMELASKWDSLDKVQQRYIATMAAGSRQQSRFIAMMSNYQRTLELVGEAENSAGAGQKQFEKTMESLEAKLNKLKNAWDSFLMGLANSDIIKAAVDWLTELITKLNDFINGMSNGNGIFKTFVTLMTSLIGMKIGGGVLKGVTGAVGAVTGLSKSSGGLFDTLAKKGLSMKVFDLSAVMEANKAALATFGSGLKTFWLETVIPILPYIVVGGIIVAGLIAIGKAIYNVTHQSEILSEKAQNLRDSADSTREKVVNLNDTIKELSDRKSELDKLTVGTKEWKEAVTDLNEQYRELIKQDEHAKQFMSFDKYGNYIFDEEGYKKYLKEVEAVANKQETLSYSYDVDSAKAALSKNLSKVKINGQDNNGNVITLSEEDKKELYNKIFSGEVNAGNYDQYLKENFGIVKFATSFDEIADSAGSVKEALFDLAAALNEYAKNFGLTTITEEQYDTSLNEKAKEYLNDPDALLAKAREQGIDTEAVWKKANSYFGQLEGEDYSKEIMDLYLQWLAEELAKTSALDFDFNSLNKGASSRAVLLNNGMDATQQQQFSANLNAMQGAGIDLNNEDFINQAADYAKQGKDIQDLIDSLKELMKVENTHEENVKALKKQMEALGIEATEEEIENLTKAWEKDQKEIKKLENVIKDTPKDYEAIAEAASEAFDSKVSKEFVEENIDLFEQFAAGGEEAVAAFEALQTKLAVANLGEAFAEGTEKAIQLGNVIDQINGQNVEIGGTADFSQIFAELAALLGSAEEAAAFLESMGYEVQWEKSWEYDEVDLTGTGNYQQIRIPHYEAKVVHTGPSASGFSSGGGSRGSGGSGGGGGGGSNSNPDRWLNPYDKFYNLTEQINEALRQREKLERDYDRILKNRWSLQKDIQGNTQARLASLKQEIEMNKRLLAGRQEQVDAVLNKKFLDDNKNVRTFREFGMDKYANYNTERGTIEINWDLIESLSGTTDTQLGSVIENFVKEIEGLQDQFEGVEKTLEDLEDEVQEILDINKEEYLSFEQRVFDAIVDREQKLIDGYSDLSETISNDNEEVLNALSESIDLSRQIRDNTKTEEEIAEKEARLAYLRRDTSGANDLAIKQLEKELEQARESYSDTLIDQELDRLSQANEDAAKQRERQIEIMQAQLDWQQKVGFFWNEVINLLQNNYGQTDEGMAKELVDLLEATDAFSGMSEFQKADWLQKLHTEWLESESGHASWRLSEAKAASMGESGKESNYSIGADQTTAGKALRYDYDRDMWLDEDEGWYTGVSYNAESNLFDYTGYSSKASRDAEAAAQAAKAQAEATKRSSVGVGSYINASGAPIYTSAYGGSPLTQYFGNDPKYLVLDDYGSSWMVRWHGLSSGITGFFRKGDVRGYKTGGLVNTTGPAWLDGTPQRPEFVLNADQTQAFMKLVDKLGNGTGAGDNYFDVNIVVDQISSDYDVDRLVDRIKQKITEDAQYRNVNAINWIR